MYVITPATFSMTTSMSLAKLAGAPWRPITFLVHSYLPLPAIVNAVYCLESLSSSCCQYPEVKSSVEKMHELAFPISLIHSPISRIAYLSS